MNLTIAVPTTGHREKLDALWESYLNTTRDMHKVHWTWIYNPLLDDTAMQYANDIRHHDGGYGTVDEIRLSHRVGLCAAWDMAIKCKPTDWIVLLNDDCIFGHEWQMEFDKLIRDHSGFDIYLLCEPYNWSGFAVNTRWYKEFGEVLKPFDYIEGYWEDNDIYLTMAAAKGLRTKDEIYRKLIYCVPYNHEGFGLFTHKPWHGKAGNRRWNDQINKAVFDQRWVQSAEDDPLAIELKNGTWWRPRHS